MNIEEKAIEVLKHCKDRNFSAFDKIYFDDETNMCVYQAIEILLTAYEKEKEKNKKAIKYCKEKSTFQTFGDFELQNVLETYINRLKHRILDILEE